MPTLPCPPLVPRTVLQWRAAAAWPPSPWSTTAVPRDVDRSTPTCSLLGAVCGSSACRGSGVCRSPDVFANQTQLLFANCRLSTPTLSCLSLLPLTVLQWRAVTSWTTSPPLDPVLPPGLAPPSAPPRPQWAATTTTTRRRTPWLKSARTPTPGPGGGRSTAWRPGWPGRDQRRVTRRALTA